MDTAPKDPVEEIEPLPESISGFTSHVVSLEPEMTLDPDNWESKLYAVSGTFEWDAADPNPEGYELTRVAYEPGAASEEEVRTVLEEYLTTMREQGYKIADLPETLPTT